MSAVGNFIGGGAGVGALGREFSRLLNPSAPGVARPKAPRSLGRLSLSQLTKLRGRTAKKKARLTRPGIGELLGSGIGQKVAGQRLAEKRQVSGRLKKVSAAREKLIRQQTTARTGRATAISTLLTRGIR